MLRTTKQLDLNLPQHSIYGLSTPNGKGKNHEYII